MEFETEQVKNIIVVRLKSGVSSDSEDQFREFLDEFKTERGKSVLLNLRGMDYINSAIMGSMVSLKKRLRRQRGDLYISDAGPFVTRMLCITHINQVIQMFSLERDAIARIR